MIVVRSTTRLLLAGLAASALTACSSTPQEAVTARADDDSAVTLSPTSQHLAGIAVENVSVELRDSTLDAVATVALDDTRTSRIGALAAGVVARVHVEVGDRVPVGAILAGLHSHEVHDSWGDYRKSVADRRRVEQELAFARDAAARTERLLNDKAASALELERARAASATAAQQLLMAEAEVRRARESLEHLGLVIDAATDTAANEIIPIRTPQKGVVLEKLVTAGTTVTPGMPLFVVSDVTSVWVLTEIDETALARVAVGMPAQVSVAAYPTERFAARVTLIGDTINPETRRVVVRCVVQNGDGRLKPGMFARVQLESGTPTPTIDVPADAVQDVGERRVVFVATSDRQYAPRDVETGRERNGRIEITRGLDAGERIVTRGAFLLKSQLLTTPDGES